MLHFAYSFPWWALLLVVAAAAAFAWAGYHRPLVPLTRTQRVTLAGLRGFTLLLVALCLFRPVRLLPPHGSRNAVVPILVDASRSMRLTDATGRSRLQRAEALVRDRLQPLVGRDFRLELFSFGDRLEPAALDRLAADERASDLAGALNGVRARLRGQQLAGIVVLSDGGFTGAEPGPARDGVPIYPVALGPSGELQDREVAGLTAGEARLDDSTIDLTASVVSRGFGRTPFDVRVLANGRPVETRRVVPVGDDVPAQQVFTVSPDAKQPTVYSVEIPADPAEAVTENNRRAVLVPPAGRRRRILFVQGAPGFEHSFLTRALALDAGLDVDIVVRKGQDATGRATYLIQADPSRAPALRAGFPSTREELDAYDAVLMGNTTADQFTHGQLELLADFVGRRGGGLLMFGGLSFQHRSFTGTPLEDVLPLELDDRLGGVKLTSLAGERLESDKVVPTPDGLDSPVMRLGRTADQTRQRWAALPALSAVAPLGGPRPGARILAVSSAPGGGILPVIAVQRYGQGRSMLFTGEAAWRWQMMMPSSDQTYDIFWRQVVRWLAAPAPDPVTIAASDDLEPGDRVPVSVTVRDAAFEPVGDATVRATVTAPGGREETLRETPADPAV
ncbi:MAG TPA: glutamine amidotransferase, partial [Vicinamibacterales bacterium]|nr:glutamine amidotransferase [Vicinamibacterales bacterium]